MLVEDVEDWPIVCAQVVLPPLIDPPAEPVGCRAPRGSGFNPGGGRTPVGRTHARTRTPSRTARGCSRGRNSASARTAPVPAPASARANRCARRRRPRAPMPPPAAPRARRDPVLRVRRARRDPVLRVRRLPAPSLRAPRPTLLSARPACSPCAVLLHVALRAVAGFISTSGRGSAGSCVGSACVGLLGGVHGGWRISRVRELWVCVDVWQRWFLKHPSFVQGGLPGALTRVS